MERWKTNHGQNKKNQERQILRHYNAPLSNFSRSGRTLLPCLSTTSIVYVLRHTQRLTIIFYFGNIPLTNTYLLNDHYVYVIHGYYCFF